MGKFIDVCTIEFLMESMGINEVEQDALNYSEFVVDTISKFLIHSNGF